MRGDRMRREGGFALALVMVFTAISLLALSGALSWASQTAWMVERSNHYWRTLAASEAATEKVIAHIARDYQQDGESMVFNRLADYRNMAPQAGENAVWSDFEFESPSGGSGTYVTRMTAWEYIPLESQYTGLHGLAARYRIISNAQSKRVRSPVKVGVRQDVQLASIPLFQFAIFYSIDLEINPGANMNVTGRVHSNGELFAEPSGATLTFESHVTAVGKLNGHKKPGDPGNRSPGTVRFESERDAGVASMNLPIGTNNSPDAIHAIIELPPAEENRSSAMGKQRYFNRCDLIITVTDSAVEGVSGSYNGFSASVPASQLNGFVNKTKTFYDKREGKTIKATEIDVGALRSWSAGNNALRASLGRDVASVYVVDLRSQSGSTMPGVRLVNGQTLPPLGLTVATPNPLYVKGHYNVPSSAIGTSNTSGTKPASLAADAITVLSGSWDDSDSNRSLNNRVAAHTTVNAAFLSGIVPTGGGIYSGGVENYPRFLERWSGRTFTYNGSMVVMFYSKTATAPWGSPDVYSPPSRNWAFDLNFLDATKLPPGTPQVTTMIRGQWATIRPGETLQ